MDSISSIYILIGIFASLVFYSYWLEFINTSNTFPRNWIMLYILNIFLHIVRVVVIENQTLDLNLFAIIAYANIYFTVFFVFGTIFLSDRKLSHQIVFLIFISLILEPILYERFKDIDGFGTGRIFLALGSMLVVGTVFLNKSFIINLTIDKDNQYRNDNKGNQDIKTSHIKNSDTQVSHSLNNQAGSILLLSFSFMHIIFLQMGISNFQNSGEIGWMENIRSLSIIFIMSLATSFSAWLSSSLQGKAKHSEMDWIIITAANVGLIAGCSLPLQSSLWNLVLFSLILGLFTALIYPFVFAKFQNPILSFLLVSLVFGGFLGFISLPFINNPDTSSYDLLFFVLERIYFSLVIVFVSCIVIWIGIGIGILIDKLQFGIERKSL